MVIFSKFLLSNSTEKRGLKNFKELLTRKCFKSEIKSEVDQDLSQEQKMIISTYCLLAAAVYFLTHMQRSLATSMEQARLISISRDFFSDDSCFFIWSRIELLDLERCLFQRCSDRTKGHIPFYFVPIRG